MTHELELNNDMFESIKYIDENGKEYWSARELQKVLNHSQWRRFNGVIEKAKITCRNSGVDINKQFVQLDKLSKNVNGGNRKILDYKLSRYACYLIAQNGDSHMKVIALAQTYFAIKTRLQELNEKDYNLLTEDEKRLYRRKQTKDGNLILYKIASQKSLKEIEKEELKKIIGGCRINYIKNFI